MRLNLPWKLPTAEKFLLFYYFTMSIWHDHLFVKLPSGWIIRPLILWFLIVIVLVKQRRRINNYLDILVFYLVIFLLFFFKFFGDNDMTVWLNRPYGVLSVVTWGGIYSYAVFRLQRNAQDILDVLKKTGVVLGIYYAWRVLEVISNGYWTIVRFDVVEQSSSNMSWSYGVLMAICFIAIYMLREKKTWIIIPILIGLFGILLYGSRGTAICFLLGSLAILLFYNEGKMETKSYIILSLGIVLAIFVFSDTGLMLISEWLNNAGLSSRFIDSLINFDTSSFDVTSNGRLLIWTTLANMIGNGPFYGYGVFGERNIIYNLGMKWGYAHNIFFEIMVAFGWLGGSIIIIAMLIGIIRFFKKVKNKDERLLFIIFLTISFELLLSNTMWLHYGPWALLALYVNHFKFKHRHSFKNGLEYRESELSK